MDSNHDASFNHHAVIQIQELIREATMLNHQYLHEEIESYLVFMLMRFMKKPQLADSTLAIELLEQNLHSVEQQKENLQHIGDKCLIYQGFFPRLAIKKSVNPNYFTSIGKSAYHSLYQVLEKGHDSNSQLFQYLADDFQSLSNILFTIEQNKHQAREQMLLLDKIKKARY